MEDTRGEDSAGSGKKRTIALIIASALLITYLHYSPVFQARALHDIYREFYYIPVLVGALTFGLAGALMSYFLCAALYLAYVFTHWTGNGLYETDRLLHFLLTGLFGILTGFFVDRERRRRKQVEREHYLAGIGQASMTVVHDLKNPLISILGFARRIMEGKGDVESSVREIIDSAGDMERIVHDVIDFARPIQLELKREDIRYAISRAHSLCSEKAEEEGVVLVADFPANPVYVMVDILHMERAIVNIINNAIEASESGQNVLIRALSKKSFVIILVKDYGEGMDSETLENAFVPFYTKKAGGSGLGMSIAKKVIEGHRGKIRIKSALGEGTEIRIELPYVPPSGRFGRKPTDKAG